jgi:predicted DNA-binding mobile mystery protein A
MEKSARLAMARRQLDSRFKQVADLRSALTPPKSGWLKTIRQTLGMSERQLGKRLSISQPAVVQLEKSEEAGSIKLDSLRRAAEALGCTLVYALIPNKSLDETITERTTQIASRYLHLVEHTMRLEDQSVTNPEVRTRQLHELAKQIDPRTLWDEP